jgi:hypothetical protein
MKLTPDEIHLLRRIARWRREMGIRYDAAMPGYALSCYYDHNGTAVTWDEDELADAAGWQLGMARNLADAPYHWVEVDSVTEAVDILAAKGLLPSRFSSAYRDGREEIEAKARALAEEYQRVDRLVHSAAVAKMLEEWTW